MSATTDETQVRTAPGDTKMSRLSRAELERRWHCVREHLKANGLQALIVQGYEDKIGGYVRWLTDVPPGYPRTVILHVDDLMTVIDHGPQGDRRRLDDGDPNRPGVGELLTTWALYGAHFTSELTAQAVADVVRERGYTAVAMAGAAWLPHGFTAGLHRLFADSVRIADATDFLDAAKSVKSTEEIALIERTAATQDAVFEKLLGWLEPGVRDFEINAYIDHQMQLMGTERGVYIGMSAPAGQPAHFAYRHFQARTMGRGDHMNVLIESNGLGGEWTELGRIVAFGKVSAEVREAHSVCVAAQAETARRCVPGALPAEIFAAHNAYMVAHGSEPEKRVHSHGQGYDAVERPFIRSDETMLLTAGLNLAIHPVYSASKTLATLCDNYLIDVDGQGRFLHRTPKRIFEL